MTAREADLMGEPYQGDNDATPQEGPGQTPAAGIGIIGCGDILDAYLLGLTRFSSTVRVVRCADIVEDLAKNAAARHGIPQSGSVESLYADDDVDVVVSLTPQKVHSRIIVSAAEAGKHVFTEKPLATSVNEAQSALERAEAAGIVVGAAPDTFLGSSIQTARTAIDRGDIGQVIGCTAFSTYSRLERWHPNPDAFFAPGAGPVLDVGPYFIAGLVNLLGPVARVAGKSAVGSHSRTVVRDGSVREIPVSVPTHAASILEFSSGVIGTFAASFDIWDHELPPIEIYGSEGTLSVPHPNWYDGEVRLRRHDDPRWWPVPPVLIPITRGPGEKIRGPGVLDLVSSLHGRPHRTNAELALHTLAVLEAIQQSSDRSEFIEIRPSCDRPVPVAASDFSEWGLS